MYSYCISIHTMSDSKCNAHQEDDKGNTSGAICNDMAEAEGMNKIKDIYRKYLLNNRPEEENTEECKKYSTDKLAIINQCKKEAEDNLPEFIIPDDPETQEQEPVDDNAYFDKTKKEFTTILNNLQNATVDFAMNIENSDINIIAEEVRNIEYLLDSRVNGYNKRLNNLSTDELKEHTEIVESINKIIEEIGDAREKFHKQYERLVNPKRKFGDDYTIRTRVFPAPFTNQKGTDIGRIEQVYEGELPYGATDYVDHFLVNLYRSIENETGQTNDQKAFEYEEADRLFIRPLLARKDNTGGGSRNAKKSASKKSRTLRKRRARK